MQHAALPFVVRLVHKAAAPAEAASQAALTPHLPGASPHNNILSRPRHSTLTHAAEAGALTPAQLRHAAKMARLSGLAYKQGEELAELLRREGLSLVARGQLHFTRCVGTPACLHAWILSLDDKHGRTGNHCPSCVMFCKASTYLQVVCGGCDGGGGPCERSRSRGGR